jgi:hypothetical protein
VLGAVTELLVAVGVGVGFGAELPDVRGEVVCTERVSGVELPLVAAGTDAAGGVFCWWPPLCSARTRAVAKAAMTAVASAPTTKPAPPLRCPSGGGSPAPTRSVARSGTGGSACVATIGGSPAAIAAAAPAPGTGSAASALVRAPFSVSAFGKTASPS